MERGCHGIVSTADVSQSLIAQAAVNSANAFNQSSAWPTANLAIFTPVTIPTQVTAFQIAWYNGTVASGNVDVGVYDAELKLLGNAGSTAQVGTSTIQVVNITDLSLPAGNYYLAMAMDNVTGTIQGGGIGAPLGRASGMAQMATAFPLPSTATFAAYNTTRQPFVALAVESSVF
jgi:hypothetical protein